MFARLASYFGGRPKIQYIVVSYDKKEYRITFTKDDYTDNSITVGSLRNMLAKQFKVPVTHLNLFVLRPQRKMSNNKAFLEDYGVENGGTVLAVFKSGQAVEDAGERPAQSAPKEVKAVQTPKEQLSAVRKAVDEDLGTERIKAFIEKPPADEKVRDKEYRMLCEVILQNTIKLDNIDVSEQPDLRLERKSLINAFHKYHADIDAANERAASPETKKQDTVKSPSPSPAGGKRKRKNKKK